MPSQRVEQALERLAEDESLLADLNDTEARALLNWIEREITAADEAPAFELRVSEIRRAARVAARAGGDPVAAAKAALAEAPQPAQQAPSSDDARRAAAAARLLAPDEDATVSPAAALLPSADKEPAAQTDRPEAPPSRAAAQLEPAVEQSTAHAGQTDRTKPTRASCVRRRRSCWRYRKAQR